MAYKVFYEGHNDEWTPPADLQSCRWCAGYHPFSCPYIESIEFGDDGTSIKRIVFRPQHYRDLRKVVLYGTPETDEKSLEGEVVA